MPAAKGAFIAGVGDFAVKDAANGEQFLAQMPHLGRRAAQHGHFQAMTLAQVYVQAGYDKVMMVMLLVDETCGQLAGMMIVDEREDGDALGGIALFTLGLLADEVIADQIADGFAARGVAARRDVVIKRRQ